MRRAAILLTSLAGVLAAPLFAREVVDAAAPSDIAVTIYRSAERTIDAKLDRSNPRGLAMISETRRVTLPAGETTIRFEGVAEGMIGVSAIVTGLPGGTIEKNRNAALLSPAALVDGTLGNRVTITRTNPATGQQVSEDAVVRTRADGGVVLQTGQGFEAVRCSGLPETLSFNRVPEGLSAAPVFSVDTRSDTGGTYDVTLTYLAWGFDWQANYVGTLKEPARAAEQGALELDLLSWLTLVNDNGQGFDNARLQIVAGRLNVTSNYQALADPPQARALSLTCYPLGSTSNGTLPASFFPPPPPPPAPPPPPMAMAAPIIVTASRLSARESAVVTATEEDLGDLKLFRVPGRVDVAAKAMKQVAFLDKDAVKADLLYQAGCSADDVFGESDAPAPADILLVTKNDAARGLGIALPQGALTLYEPSPRGERLAGASSLRDYARGQDIELDLAPSSQVFARCGRVDAARSPDGRRWTMIRADLTNANPHPVRMRLKLDRAGGAELRFAGHKVVVKNGWQIVEVTVPANTEKRFDWRMRESSAQ